MLQKDALGIGGEAAAERHLSAKGHRVIARRVRMRFGEIDLVALDGREVVFVEVKTRRGRGFGAPEDAITWQKREHLRRCAWAWMADHRLNGRPFRIDVVSVLVGRPGAEPIIVHFENAVGETG
jgi:putative endonuclease